MWVYWLATVPLERQAAGDQADRLLVAACVLTGLRLGRRRFGEADESIRQQIEAVRAILVLEDLSERLLIVSSWHELMA